MPLARRVGNEHVISRWFITLYSWIGCRHICVRVTLTFLVSVISNIIIYMTLLYNIMFCFTQDVIVLRFLYCHFTVHLHSFNSVSLLYVLMNIECTMRFNEYYELLTLTDISNSSVARGSPRGLDPPPDM